MINTIFEILQSLCLIISAILILIASIGILRLKNDMTNVIYAKLHFLGIVDVAGVLAMIGLNQPLLAAIYFILAPIVGHAMANAYYYGEDEYNKELNASENNNSKNNNSKNNNSKNNNLKNNNSKNNNSKNNNSKNNNSKNNNSKNNNSKNNNSKNNNPKNNNSKTNNSKTNNSKNNNSKNNNSKNNNSKNNNSKNNNSKNNNTTKFKEEHIDNQDEQYSISKLTIINED